MEEENKRYDYVEDVEISKEMRTAFLDYSMSVIVSRALPDVRDGMKPDPRRFLQAERLLFGGFPPFSPQKKGIGRCRRYGVLSIIYVGRS